MNGAGGGIALGAVLLFYLVVLLLVFGSIGLAIWAIVDAARRPDWQFEATGQNKVLWIVLPAAGAAMCQLVSLVSALIYLLSIRKKLDAAVPPPYGYQPGYLPPGPVPPGPYNAAPPGPYGPPPGWPPLPPGEPPAGTPRY